MTRLCQYKFVRVCKKTRTESAIRRGRFIQNSQHRWSYSEFRVHFLPLSRSLATNRLSDSSDCTPGSSNRRKYCAIKSYDMARTNNTATDFVSAQSSIFRRKL